MKNTPLTNLRLLLNAVALLSVSLLFARSSSADCGTPISIVEQASSTGNLVKTEKISMVALPTNRNPCDALCPTHKLAPTAAVSESYSLEKTQSKTFNGTLAALFTYLTGGASSASSYKTTETKSANLAGFTYPDVGRGRKIQAYLKRTVIDRKETRSSGSDSGSRLVTNDQFTLAYVDSGTIGLNQDWDPCTDMIMPAAATPCPTP